MERQLAALSAQPWPATGLGCSRAQVEEYADCCEQIEELSERLQARKEEEGMGCKGAFGWCSLSASWAIHGPVPGTWRAAGGGRAKPS